MHFQGGGGGHPEMDDMMAAMFGGMMGGGMMGGGGRAPRRRQGRDIGHVLPVTLEDLYIGKELTLPREKTILCPPCKGTGAKVGAKSGGPCRDCRGQGVRVVMRPVGPGMVQQMRAQCDSCNGQGSVVTERDKCTECRGARVKQVEAPLKVKIQRGMEDQQQIPFPGEGDQSPDIDVPGAIVIVLNQQKHETFRRDGMDLHIKKKISLAEALCGFETTIDHLDGRVLVIKNAPGNIVKPGEVKAILKEGMPHPRDPTRFGDLLVEFVVEFPERTHDGQIEVLRTALPPPANLDVDFKPEECEECHLSRQPLDDVRKEMAKQEDDDDEGQGGGGGGQGGIRCAQQ